MDEVENLLEEVKDFRVKSNLYWRLRHISNKKSAIEFAEKLIDAVELPTFSINSVVRKICSTYNLN